MRFALSVILLIFLLGVTSRNNHLFAQNEQELTFIFSEAALDVSSNRELAVGFHSIAFLDSTAKVISELKLGNIQANSRQDSGWYHNEISPVPGSFQWTGRNGLKATIHVAIPPGADGILFGIMGSADSLWMSVELDGQVLDTIRSGNYWHQAYLPLKEALTPAIPGKEPLWLPDRLFPKFPKDEVKYGFRVRTPLADAGHGTGFVNWRINQSFDIMMALTLTSMQGLINRYGSSIYIEWYDPPAFDWQSKYDESRAWRTQADADSGFDAFFHLDGHSTINFLHHYFSTHFEGVVVYDPEIPETINLATMIAGLENRVILAPEQLTMPGMPDFGNIKDLRLLVQQKGWDNSNPSRVDIYQWVYDSLWTDLDKHQIGMMSPGPPSYQGIDGSTNYFKLNLVERDFIIATQSSALWLSPVDGTDSLLLNLFITEAQQPPVLTGVMWNHELPTVDFVSRRGGWVSGHTWPETYSDANLSFWGSFPDAEPYQADIRPEAIWATFGGGPIVLLHSSDGDALFYQMQKGFPSMLWDQSHRQHFGWTMNPSLFDMAPPIWNHYNKSRDKAALIAGISGIGYAFQTRMNDPQLGEYLSWTGSYFDRTGLQVVHAPPYDPGGLWLSQFQRIGKAYYDSLNTVGYLGMLASPVDLGRNFNFYFPDRPAPIGWTSYGFTGANLQETLDEILDSDTPDTTHIEVEDPQLFSPLNVVYDSLAQGDSALLLPFNYPTGFVFGPDKIDLPPGDHNLIWRMKVDDNSSNTVAYQVFTFNQGTQQVIANYNFRPSDFIQSGTYQEFNFPFSLDSYATEISTSLFYLDSSHMANLSIDYIHIERNTSSTLPDFSGMIISNFGFDGVDLPNKITDLEVGLAREGGAVVNPEEWFAAINPEYMLGFAENYLGAGHSSLLQAQEEMDSSLYMKALITIRKALISNAPLEIFLTENGPIHCFGDSTGIMIAEIIGGTPPYIYEWNTPLGAGNIAEGLPAGTYTLKVTDSSGFKDSVSHTFFQPDPIGIDVHVTAGIGCKGNTGQAIATISGGNPEFQYAIWNGGIFFPLQIDENQHFFAQLSSGPQIIEMGDWRGCNSFENFQIPVNVPLSAQIFSLEDTSQTGNHTAWVVPQGGNPPYSIFWNTDPEQRSDTLFNLNDGTYNATIMDAQGCMVDETVVVHLEASAMLNKFQVYPNPSTGELKVNILIHQPQTMSLELRDAKGGLLLHLNKKNTHVWEEFLDLSSLPQGIYILTLELESERVSKRIMVGNK